MQRDSVLRKERDETPHIVAPVNTGTQSLPRRWELRRTHTPHHRKGTENRNRYKATYKAERGPSRELRQGLLIEVYACLGRSRRGARFKSRVCQSEGICKVKRKISVSRRGGMRSERGMGKS
jgi:hypothetical protein